MKKKTILLVEDEGVVRDMIRGALDREYDVLEASSYSGAMTQLKKHIDLALIDYALPDRDGFEVLKAVRETRPTLPVILMTGYGSEHVVIKALREGVTDYIKKPLSFSYLMKRISELLGMDLGNTFWKDTVTREEFVMDGIAAYIEERSMEDLNLDKLAAIVGMSRFNFCRAFKNRLGLSFISYLNSIRVKKAARLLDDPNLSVTEIAIFVGYGSVAHFGRVFKSVYGVSPRAYRKKVRAKEQK